MKSGQLSCLLNIGFIFICMSGVTLHKVSADDIASQADNFDADPVADNVLDLLRVLDEETKLATRTKMNIDFVPGMVSVLHSEELLARGKRTVFDALALIPGVELSHSQDGQLQVIVRGLGKTFSSAKVKFLLNDIPFNTTLTAVSTALIIPLEQVDRIEVIRGPGSAIYGEFASAGVVNIITHQETSTNNAYTRLGSVGKSYTVGGQLHESFDAGKSSMTINYSQYERENSGLTSGTDILAGTPNAAVSNAPGKINDAELDRSFIMNLQVDKYHVTWNFIERGFGDYYGLANALPSSDSKIIRTLSMQGLEVSRPWRISKQIQSTIKLGWSNYVFDSDQAKLFPAGFTFIGNGTTYPDGVMAGPNYVEDKYYMGLESKLTGIHDHDILVGLDISSTQQGETYAERNYSVSTTGAINPAPNQTYTGESNWLGENLSRRVIGIYAQDQYALNQRWDITAGIRYDDYDDVGNDITPRLAAVYHYTNDQTVKVQYAQSFRPPTFLEMNLKNNIVVSGNPDLDSEQLNSFEFGYVFNNGTTISRVTLFRYEMENLIGIDSLLRRYENLGSVDANGFELEYLQQIKRNFKFDGNLSYTSAELESGGQIPGVAKLMANAGFIYQPKLNLSFSIQYRFVGERKREVNDSRPALAAYNTVDLGVSTSRLFSRHITLRGFVSNLFDEEVKTPSFLVQNKVPYQDDYQFSKRAFELQLMYEFQ